MHLRLTFEYLQCRQIDTHTQATLQRPQFNLISSKEIEKKNIDAPKWILWTHSYAFIFFWNWKRKKNKHRDNRVWKWAQFVNFIFFLSLMNISANEIEKNGNEQKINKLAAKWSLVYAAEWMSMLFIAHNAHSYKTSFPLNRFQDLPNKKDTYRKKTRTAVLNLRRFLLRKVWCTHTHTQNTSYPLLYTLKNNMIIHSLWIAGNYIFICLQFHLNEWLCIVVRYPLWYVKIFIVTVHYECVRMRSFIPFNYFSFQIVFKS